MNTQPCQDCSVVIQCIAHGGYPHHVAMCSRCRGIFPITTVVRNPSLNGRLYSAPPFFAPPRVGYDDYDLVSIGDQIHIPMACPKHTLDFKQLRAAAAQRFVCRPCTEKISEELRHFQSTNHPQALSIINKKRTPP